jgi:uncharacterized protein YcbK (DUF882 family)
MIHSFIDKIITLSLRYDFSVTSWIRSKKHNVQVDGSNNSRHLLGLAVDIILDDKEEIFRLKADAIRMNLIVVNEGDHLHVQTN